MSGPSSVTPVAPISVTTGSTERSPAPIVAVGLLMVTVVFVTIASRRRLAIVRSTDQVWQRPNVTPALAGRETGNSFH